MHIYGTTADFRRHQNKRNINRNNTSALATAELQSLQDKRLVQVHGVADQT